MSCPGDHLRKVGAGFLNDKFKTPVTVDCLSCEEENRLHSDNLVPTRCTEIRTPGRNMSSLSAWEEVACTQSENRDELPEDTTAVDHEGLAWEIDFSSSSAGKKPKKPVPKFLLREREKKQRSEQLKEDVSPSLKSSLPKKATSPPSKVKTTPERTSKSPLSRSLSPRPSARAPLPVDEKTKKSPPLKRSLLPWGGKLKRPSSAQPLKLPSPQNHTSTSRPSSAKALAVIRREGKTPHSSPISESRTPPSSPRRQSPRAGKNGVRSTHEFKSSRQRNAGTGDLRPKMEEPLPSDDGTSSVGTRPRAEQEVEGVTESAGCGGTVWEIDLSSFKTGKKTSRPPRSKRDTSPILTRPLQPKQLMKVTLPQSEVSNVPVPTIATLPQEMEQRKVLDLRRWYVVRIALININCACHMTLLGLGTRHTQERGSDVETMCYLGMIHTMTLQTCTWYMYKVLYSISDIEMRRRQRGMSETCVPHVTCTYHKTENTHT